MQTWSIRWRFGSLTVNSLGAMIAPIEFRLSESKVVQPMYISAWSYGGCNDERLSHEPPILHNLRGEWVCVPFGAARKLNGDPQTISRWQQSEEDTVADGPPPGLSSNAQWRLASQSDTELRLFLDYDTSHPVRRVERRIWVDPESPRVFFELKITSRNAVDLPVALHPTFSIPDRLGDLEIVSCDFRCGITFPGRLEASSMLAEGAEFDRLSAVPMRDGSLRDLTRLPLSACTEELLQLIVRDPSTESTTVSFVLKYLTEGYAAELSWNARDFPSVLLWLSNKGRPSFPWNSQNLALGVEPLRGCFDLGTRVSARPNNPLRERFGIETTLAMPAQSEFTTQYSIRVFPINNEK